MNTPILQTKFVATEKSISKQCGHDIPYPIRVFSLTQLGIDKIALTKVLSDNIKNLAWDYYDLRKAQLKLLKHALPQHLAALKELEDAYYMGHEKITVLQPYIDLLSPAALREFKDLKPHRRRAICQFTAHRAPENQWNIERIVEQGFTQNVVDYRLQARVFKQTPETVSQHPAFQHLLQQLICLTLEFRPKAKRIKLVAHEMATVARDDKPGDNSPEGIHQDGSQFIVSALVIERKGVLEGRSQIMGPDKKTMYFDYILKEGEGIFQKDLNTTLWHRVTSIYRDPNAGLEMGERNILGFDIDVMEEED